jgi:hypothetical protein
VVGAALLHHQLPYKADRQQMTPLEMIAEWRKGCSCGPQGHPEDCRECTVELINAMELWLRKPLWERVWLRSRGNEWLRRLQARRAHRHLEPPVDVTRVHEVAFKLAGTKTKITSICSPAEVDGWAFRKALAEHVEQCGMCHTWIEAGMPCGTCFP